MTSPASTRPSLRSIEVFAAAAEALSFQQAAARLNLTPSAVSHRIRELETVLGQPLFLRAHRQLTLTEAGLRYLAAVREALAALHAASDALRLPRGNTLRLSATLSFASTWLMPRLAAFQRAHPGIELVLATDLKLADFARGEAHAAVRFGAGRWPGLTAHRLLDLHAYPVRAPGRKPARASSAALAREPLLAVRAGRGDITTLLGGDSTQGQAGESPRVRPWRRGKRLSPKAFRLSRGGSAGCRRPG